MTLLVDIYKHVSLKGLMPKPSCRFSECIHFSGGKKISQALMESSYFHVYKHLI